MSVLVKFTILAPPALNDNENQWNDIQYLNSSIISLQGTELHQLSDDVISLPPSLDDIRWLAFPPSLHEYRFVPERPFFFLPTIQ